VRDRFLVEAAGVIRGVSRLTRILGCLFGGFFGRLDPPLRLARLRLQLFRGLESVIERALGSPGGLHRLRGLCGFSISHRTRAYPITVTGRPIEHHVSAESPAGSG
jgi:hypothetical protein